MKRFHAGATCSVARKLLAVLMAVVLCTGLSPATSSWADEGGASSDNVQMTAQTDAAGSATLTIVAGLAYDGSPNVVVNKTYSFYQDATLENLLDAAVSEGDIKAYSLNSYGYLASITKADGTVMAGASDSSTYWSDFEDGSYYGGSDTIATEKLKDGVDYQFAWNSYPTATPPADWSACGTPDVSTGSVAGGTTGVGSATLTIVHGLAYDGTPDVVLNKTYRFATDATLEDLLDVAVASGDIKAYALNSYGYLSSITTSDNKVITGASDSSTYWSNFENGSYYQGSDTIKTEKLADGVNYQIAWNSYPTAVPPTDWSACGTPTDGSTAAGTRPDTPAPDPDANTPTAVDSNGAAAIYSNIADSFSGTGEDWKAMELFAAGKGSTVDTSALLANAKAAATDPGTTDLQRSIIALVAAGIDPTAVTVDGTTYDLVSLMGTTPVATNTVNGKLWTVLAYAVAGVKTAPSTATESIDELLADIEAAQLADGGFAYSGSSADPDMTAMAISCLQPYQSVDGVSTVLDGALSALKGLQNADGGWGGNWPAATGATNANSTAMAIVALCAMGIDPSTQWAASDGTTPLAALLSQANASQTGFLYNGEDNELATEQGFRALAAYYGLVNTKAAYNIYVQAKDGQATVPDAGSDEKPQGDDQGDEPVKSASVSNKTATAATGDGTSAPLTAAALGALCALALAGASARRRSLCQKAGR